MQEKQPNSPNRNILVSVHQKYKSNIKPSQAHISVDI